MACTYGDVHTYTYTAGKVGGNTSGCVGMGVFSNNNRGGGGK